MPRGPTVATLAEVAKRKAEARGLGLGARARLADGAKVLGASVDVAGLIGTVVDEHISGARFFLTVGFDPPGKPAIAYSIDPEDLELVEPAP